MDGSRFDDLTRALARRRSRRSLLAGITGGLTGALTGRVADAGQLRGQALGAACTRATECASFMCVDGVCCDSACTGQCESCASGTCRPASGPPPPGKPPCPGSGACAATCDGVTGSTCAAFPGPETACGPATCANGWLTTSACGGNGSCTPTTTSCAPYGCDASGTACGSGCASDAECPAGHHCDGGVCQQDEGLGEPCDEPGDCRSGFCVNNVCCATACGPCQVCNAPGSAGFCAPGPDDTECAGGRCCAGACVDVSSDTMHCGDCHNACPGTSGGPAICVGGECDVECVSGTTCGGNCVDVLTDVAHCGECDHACPGIENGQPDCAGGACGTVCLPGFQRCSEDGPCVACCSAADCAGAGTTCGGVCGGPDNPTCSYPDETTVCGEPTCSDTATREVQVCNGAGACTTIETDCTPYACCGRECVTTCPDSSHCADGYRCVDGVCDLALPVGESCAANDDCASQLCLNDVCVCRSATGPCLSNSDCCGELCVAGECACRGNSGPCVATSDCCDSLATCTAGVCCLAQSEVCEANADCCSGFCVDGRCCDTACTGQCEVCDLNQPSVGTFFGTCTPLPAGHRPHLYGRPACDGDGTTCGGACGGPDNPVCVYPDDTTACAPATCDGSTAHPARVCDGDGACAPSAEAQDCNPFSCRDGACLTTCDSTDDCAAGHRCVEGVCDAALPVNSPCTANEECASELCLDEVCVCRGATGPCLSNSDCCGELCVEGACVCRGNSGPCVTTNDCCDSLATCTTGVCCQEEGQRCGANADCCSGFCVDGYCCNEACDKQCEFCGYDNFLGRCITVFPGEQPRGDRPACATDGTVCGGACSGTRDDICAFPDDTTDCAPATCDGSTAHPARVCDGDGACAPSAGAQDCTPFTCRGGECLTTCNSADDCAAGHRCVDGSCDEALPPGSQCGANEECGGELCIGNTCVCRGPTGPCTGNQDCCGELCIDSQCVCRGPSGPCESNQDCCGELCTSDICQCRDAGGTCVTDNDCCDGRCTDNQCVALSDLGEACNSHDQCRIGFCVNFKCCDQPCTEPCYSCELPGKEGTCDVDELAFCDHDDPCVAFARCRADSNGAAFCDAIGVIDCPDTICASYVCDTAAGGCVVHEFFDETTVCRPAAGPCDAPEVCTGNSPDCPDDELYQSDHVCRPDRGACDVAEFCTGNSIECPVDRFADVGTACGPPEAGSCRYCGPDGTCEVNPNGRSCGDNKYCCNGECVNGSFLGFPNPCFQCGVVPCESPPGACHNCVHGICTETHIPLDGRCGSGSGDDRLCCPGLTCRRNSVFAPLRCLGCIPEGGLCRSSIGTEIGPCCGELICTPTGTLLAGSCQPPD